MKILFIGDITGRPGRNATKEALKMLNKKHEFDLVIANGENLAHGAGMSKKTFEEMTEAGVDFFTSGNHIFRRGDIYPELEKAHTKVLRPANYPPGNVGKGCEIVTKKGKKILVINIIGRVFFSDNYDCPFRKMDEILDEFNHEKPDAVIVDFHAEATSEKIAMRHYLDGRVTALLGTHTHVQTADDMVTEKGTAYITDVGMVGPIDSIIGAEKNTVLEGFLKQTGFSLDIPAGPCIFNAVVIEISGKAKAKSIERINIII
jgi:2',3'-cyclic-nucleotide 2'-phosphodiesterase